MEIPFDNSYVSLPERFFSRVNPEPVSAPETIRVNGQLAQTLGIDADWLASPAGAQVIVGNQIPEGAEPIATAYAGHQFGHWNPQLGDGRAILLGEVIGTDGVRYDLQLKGSGRTPYSRRGDGRAPLGPVLREYVVGEAMAALGIPTSRTLAAATTGDVVFRNEVLPGGVLIRVAESHIRVGTFELFASRQDDEGLRALVDYVIKRHYPDVYDSEIPAVEMLRQIVAKQAELIAQWQLVGFIHGVMNTDNMLVSGQTIDYGPCAFMDTFHPNQVYSSIDHHGRYAYSNQPTIAHWNLSSLARALVPILHENRERAAELAREAVDSFHDLFAHAYVQGMRQKLGLDGAEEDDVELIADLLGLMHETKSDYTLTFRRLMGGHGELDARFTPWLNRWRPRTSVDSLRTMQHHNPVYIPRNHHVEAAIESAEREQSFDAFHTLVDVVTDPFSEQVGQEAYALPPKPEEIVKQTFCGT